MELRLSSKTPWHFFWVGAKSGRGRGWGGIDNERAAAAEEEDEKERKESEILFDFHRRQEGWIFGTQHTNYLTTHSQLHFLHSEELPYSCIQTKPQRPQLKGTVWEINQCLINSIHPLLAIPLFLCLNYWSPRYNVYSFVPMKLT